MPVENSPRPSPQWDLPRIILGVITIGALVMASFWVVRPFLLAGIWATMIVVSTWPALLMIQSRARGRRGIAVLVMTAVMLLLVVVPLGVAVIGTAQRSNEILAFSRSVEEYVIAGPPDWVQRLPVVGGDLAERWAAITASPGNLTEYIGASARAIALWIVGQVGTVAALVIQLLLTVLIAAILYANGETAAAGVCAFARRLAGPSGERAAILSGRAIRAVAMGIVVTALIQSLLGGLGLLVIGVPHALLLTSVMFVLGIAQIGPIPVLIGAVFWGYQSYGMFWGTVILVWALATGMIDNVLRPILIKRGANLPLLLIFVGVLGGLFAFGVIGLFVGPVVLSVAYTLLQEWVAQGEGRRSDEPGSDAARGAVP